VSAAKHCGKAREAGVGRGGGGFRGGVRGDCLPGKRSPPALEKSILTPRGHCFKFEISRCLFGIDFGIRFPPKGLPRRPQETSGRLQDAIWVRFEELYGGKLAVEPHAGAFSLVPIIGKSV